MDESRLELKVGALVVAALVGAFTLLVLMGEYERIFKPYVAVERARKLIPGLVSAEIVPDAGHLMTTDQPQWLQERIFRFIQDAV